MSATEVEKKSSADWKSRFGVALLAGGGAVCGLVLALGEGVNFVRGCYTENVVRNMVGINPADLMEFIMSSFETR